VRRGQPGRLHHTNIVPVFGVGVDGGICSYAMQFIAGQPLDQMVTELRRLRSVSPTRQRSSSFGWQTGEES
jgi:hypothetical protein